jgi:Flp pilus assembly protein protease CpaA
MKKNIFTFLFILFTLKIWAYDVKIDNVYYNLNTITYEAEVTQYSYYNSYSGSVIIPSSIDYSGSTYNVTRIGEKAFYVCKNLTSVTIPNSITAIGQDAFFSCTSLTSVNITDIEAWCKINFATINSNPLFYARNLYINGEIISDLVIPESIVFIGNYTFYGCNALRSVTIPNSVVSIGNSVFKGCENLISVSIPNSVTSIGARAFEDCYSLKSISIPNGVATIAEGTFSNCNSLPSIEIPNSITTIEKDAFSSCFSITSIKIPNSVNSIGEYAFWNCRGLTSIEMPNSITTIYEGTFAKCSALISMAIPNSVTSINNDAFYSCYGLTSIIISDKVSNIGEGAFSYCSSLVELICKAFVPPICYDNTFKGMKKEQCTLYIPFGSIEAYKNADQWKDFNNIIESFPTDINNIYNNEIKNYYDLNGRQIQQQRGINIIKTANGKIRKVLIK